MKETEDDDRRAESKSKAIEDNYENRKPAHWRVGMRVEREIDGIWFPATIRRIDVDEDTFEIEYDDEHNIESDVVEEELR